VGGGRLAPNTTHVFYFQFEIPGTAGNEIEDTTVTFHVQMDATQWISTAW
jgi:hypothetical protein